MVTALLQGDPIGVERLMAAPYTSYCFDAQEDQEKTRSFSGLSKTASYLEKLAGEYISLWK